MDDSVVFDKMKSLPQWVAWKLKERDGKKSKVPYQINGTQASVINPNHWVSYHIAKSAKGFDGIGFVFNDCEIIGIDFDYILNEDGSLNSMQYERILKALRSEEAFIEVSPSGKGLHAYYSGSLDFGPNKKKFDDGSAIEVYKTGRYFTVTENGWVGVA